MGKLTTAQKALMEQMIRQARKTTDLKQDIIEEKFKEQVNWELDLINEADVIALYLQANTMSPISLLELGRHVKDGKLVVCCLEGFWRRGNVQIVCDRYGIPLLDTEEVSDGLEGQDGKARHGRDREKNL